MAKNDAVEDGESDESAESGEPVKSGGKRKLIIIGAAAAVVLIGAGLGAYLFFGHSPSSEQQASEEPAIPVEADPVIVPIANVVAPLIQDGELTGYAYFNLNIEVRDVMIQQKVNENLPLLRDAFARDLYSNSVADPKSPNRADVGALQTRLLKDAKRIFGADSVNKIYIAQIRYSGV